MKNCKEDGTPIDEQKEEENENRLQRKMTTRSAVGLTAWDYIKTLFALVFVVGFLFALLKFINRKNRMYDKNRFMKNMGGFSLGQHKSVQLVVIGKPYYLIGVGEDIQSIERNH